MQPSSTDGGELWLRPDRQEKTFKFVSQIKGKIVL
jgi:hypothetical protein